MLYLHYLSTEINVSFYTRVIQKGATLPPTKPLANRSRLTPTQPLNPYSQDGALSVCFPVLRPSNFLPYLMCIESGFRRFWALTPLTGSRRKTSVSTHDHPQ